MSLIFFIFTLWLESTKSQSPSIAELANSKDTITEVKARLLAAKLQESTTKIDNKIKNKPVKISHFKVLSCHKLKKNPSIP